THPKPATVTYYKPLDSFDIPLPYEGGVVVTSPLDTIDAALRCKGLGLRPLVLNMASDYHPGGGVAKGSQAQEECLFRRTNYFLHLNEELVEYPFKPTQVVLSPGVAVIKDRNYQLMDSFETLDFVACAAVRKPRLTADGRLPS